MSDIEDEFEYFNFLSVTSDLEGFEKNNLEVFGGLKKIISRYGKKVSFDKLIKGWSVI